MPAVTIRNLSDETHRALKLLAARHGRSTEAEIRSILDLTVRPPARVMLGSALSAMSSAAGITNADVDALDLHRDRTPVEPIRFE